MSLILGALFVSCSSIQGQKIGKEYVTKTGVKYTITAHGKGHKPAAGDKVQVHFEGFYEDGKRFESTYDRGMPFVFTVGVGQVIKGWDDIFPLMKAGTKFNLTVPSVRAFGSKQAGKIPPNSTLHYHVNFEQIIAPPKPFNVAELDTITMENGLRYIQALRFPHAKPAGSFKTVRVHYTGYLDNGNIFDSSYNRGGPFEFQIGIEQVIKGWEEGIVKMREGEKFRLIIPPDMAYGEKGMPPLIPQNATLIFDVELVEVLN